jgi:hypothetical protein
MDTVSLSLAECDAQAARTNYDNINTMLRVACGVIGVRYTNRTTKHRDHYPTDITTVQFKTLLDERTFPLLLTNTGGKLQNLLRRTAASLPSIPVGTSRTRMHVEEFCEECHRLGRYCKLRMELSRSARHPSDVVVKGIPIDMSESRLIEIFRSYGEILRVHILPTDPHFPDRMGFATFVNPSEALRKFNHG